MLLHIPYFMFHNPYSMLHATMPPCFLFPCPHTSCPMPPCPHAPMLHAPPRPHALMLHTPCHHAPCPCASHPMSPYHAGAPALSFTCAWGHLTGPTQLQLPLPLPAVPIRLSQSPFPLDCAVRIFPVNCAVRITRRDLTVKSCLAHRCTSPFSRPLSDEVLYQSDKRPRKSLDLEICSHFAHLLLISDVNLNYIVTALLRRISSQIHATIQSSAFSNKVTSLSSLSSTALSLSSGKFTNPSPQFSQARTKSMHESKLLL
jgi:hypothetical protein